MDMLRSISTSRRLVMLISGAYLLAFLLLGAGVYVSVSARMEADTRSYIDTDLADLRELHRSYGLPGLRDFVTQSASDTDRSDMVYTVFDDRGRVLAGRALPASIMAGGPGWKRFHAHGEDGARVVARLVRLSDGHYLLAGLETRAEDGFLAIMARAAGLALLIALLLALAMGWAISRWIGHRLERLDATVARVGAGELQLRVQSDGSGDGFDRIGLRFNGMLDRIGELLDGVREVSDHIAHDLRTPLTRLRNRLSVARMGVADASPVAQDLDAALADTDQLLQTFAAMLRLSRIEAQPQPGEWPLLRLDTLLQDAVELYAPIAAERGIRLQLDAAPASLHGDADQLFQMGVNLLDNALKYGPPDSVVELTLTRDHSSWRLDVADAGAGIPEAEHQRVFDRFHRLEAHRGSEGHGLGLPLVQAIVRRHGGQISLLDNRPGLRVRVRLPAD